MATLIETVNRLSEEIAELRKLLVQRDAEITYLRSALTNEQVTDLIQRFPCAEDESKNKKPRRTSPAPQSHVMVEDDTEKQ